MLLNSDVVLLQGRGQLVGRMCMKGFDPLHEKQQCQQQEGKYATERVTVWTFHKDGCSLTKVRKYLIECNNVA